MRLLMLFILALIQAVGVPLMELPQQIFALAGRTKEHILKWPAFSVLGNAVGSVAVLPNKDRVLGETSRVQESALGWISSGTPVSRLPLDTVLRGLSIRMTGTATYTFASAPVASDVSTMDNIVSRIEVMVDGGRPVKSVRPHMLHMQQILATQIQGVRKASSGAAAAYLNNPTADGGFTYGLTTQTTTVAESVFLSFEHWLCKYGSDQTWLNLKNRTSADLKFVCATAASLDLTTNATFTAAAFAFEIITVEARDYPTPVSWDWKQTLTTQTFAAQVTDYIFRLTLGNKFSGISFFVMQNSDGSSGTSSLRKLPNDNSLKNIKIRRNGREIVNTTFQTLQDQNRMRFGVSAAYASNKTRLAGFAHLDLLTDRALSSAIGTGREDGVDSFDLLLTLNASDATNNVYPIDINIETHELVRVA